MGIRIGILGYGNLARGIESAIRQNPDMELSAVFTRREPEKLNIQTKGVKLDHVDNILSYKEDIDVLMLCGGSATDLPDMSPRYARHFNIIDSFDTHKNIPAHFENVDRAARETGHLAMISAGWDPGMFSLNRLYSEAVLPDGKSYTFWGKGVSQGHSDALRRIEGVADARQYTVPVDKALEEARSGRNPELYTREMHTRECFVVLEDGADSSRIEQEIKNMPNYFADYDTTVHFITQEELDREHKGLPHGGFVLRSGVTGLEKENHELIEYRLRLDSNPEFTGSVLAAYGRAVYRMVAAGFTGGITVFDVAPKYLNMRTEDEQRRQLL